MGFIHILKQFPVTMTYNKFASFNWHRKLNSNVITAIFLTQISIFKLDTPTCICHVMSLSQI